MHTEKQSFFELYYYAELNLENYLSSRHKPKSLEKSHFISYLIHAMKSWWSWLERTEQARDEMRWDEQCKKLVMLSPTRKAIHMEWIEWVHALSTFQSQKREKRSCTGSLLLFHGLWPQRTCVVFMCEYIYLYITCNQSCSQ